MNYQHWSIEGSSFVGLCGVGFFCFFFPCRFILFSLTYIHKNFIVHKSEGQRVQSPDEHSEEKWGSYIVNGVHNITPYALMLVSGNLRCKSIQHSICSKWSPFLQGRNENVKRPSTFSPAQQCDFVNSFYLNYWNRQVYCLEQHEITKKGSKGMNCFPGNGLCTEFHENF